MWEIFIAFFSGGLILTGLLGVFLPFLPGVPVSWIGLALYAFVTDFAEITPLFLGITFALTILTVVVDFAAPIWGAKKYEASKYGLLGASIGVFLGLITLGPIGIVLGPFLGALLGELVARKAAHTALSAAAGTFIGFFVGFVLKLFVLTLVLGGFLIALIF